VEGSVVETRRGAQYVMITELQKYKRHLARGADETTRIRCIHYVEQRHPVVIAQRDDIWAKNDMHWAVIVEGIDPEFWLEAFRMKKRAVQFCENLGLPHRVV
jgi:hypothetical protein